MAVPSDNPIADAFIPLVTTHPRGSDMPTEALRMALLGVAAIHQSHLLRRATQDGASEMFTIAKQYRLNSKTLLTKACTTLEGCKSDASLAASITIALMDVSCEFVISHTR